MKVKTIMAALLISQPVFAEDVELMCEPVAAFSKSIMLARQLDYPKIELIASVGFAVAVQNRREIIENAYECDIAYNRDDGLRIISEFEQMNVERCKQAYLADY